MPRPPQAVSAVAAIPDGVFSPLAESRGAGATSVFPLHVGDTWLEPFEGGRMEDLRSAEHVGLHRYSDTRGLPELVAALVEKVRDQNELACEQSSVLVTAGATAALAASVGMLADPGDELLVLAPFWPLIRGIVQSFRAVPVEVPFFDRVDSVAAAVEAVRERTTPRTVALYISTPSNPTGRLIPAEWLAALAEWARRENLWILSDEVYEELVYRGAHVSVGRFAPERTVTVFSFSKAYGMAGNRVGYLVGPPEAVTQIRKVTTHSVYSAPTAGQFAALRALRAGRTWLARARELYRAAGEEAARVLGLPAPEGSTFLFLDVRDRLDQRGLSGFLEDCLKDGVLVAPGASSGEAYANWVRVCYTACPPAELSEAVRRLARRLQRDAVPASTARAGRGRPG